MAKRALAFGAAFTLAALLAFALAIPATALAGGFYQPKVSIQKTAAIKTTNSLITYPGAKTTLKATASNTRSATITWSSTNKKVATVSKKGVVTAKAPGRCYVKASAGGVTAKLLVEVTSKQAYRAVQNAFADMQAKIVYSQPKRMAKNCRDCSSFVSRCYWDSTLGRNIFAIGGTPAKSWALPAAAQAQWLNKKGRAVAQKACAVKNLRPGDTLYFETGYAGKDKTQWRYIDHAALYVGNGYVMDTSGKGGKGAIGFRWCKYSASDATIKFIGRPCP